MALTIQWAVELRYWINTDFVLGLRAGKYPRNE